MQSLTGDMHLTLFGMSWEEIEKLEDDAAERIRASRQKLSETLNMPVSPTLEHELAKHVMKVLNEST